MVKTVSKEIRWFFSEAEARPVEEWFANLPVPQRFVYDDLYPRQDYYLRLPEADNLGVKIREPKEEVGSGKLKTALEFKQLLSDSDLLALPRNSKGYTNRWQKLSMEMTAGETGMMQIDFSFPLSDAKWLRVDKDRLIIKYDCVRSTLSERDDLAEACGIELTKIKVSENVYYSFGLEAFSESGKQLEQNFIACCDYAFENLPLKELLLSTSFSYPGFLKNLIISEV